VHTSKARNHCPQKDFYTSLSTYESVKQWISRPNLAMFSMLRSGKARWLDNWNTIILEFEFGESNGSKQWHPNILATSMGSHVNTRNMLLKNKANQVNLLNNYSVKLQLNVHLLAPFDNSSCNSNTTAYQNKSIPLKTTITENKYSSETRCCFVNLIYLTTSLDLKHQLFTRIKFCLPTLKCI
jgi:hypothetical protein